MASVSGILRKAEFLAQGLVASAQVRTFFTEDDRKGLEELAASVKAAADRSDFSESAVRAGEAALNLCVRFEPVYGRDARISRVMASVSETERRNRDMLDTLCTTSRIYRVMLDYERRENHKKVKDSFSSLRS